MRYFYGWNITIALAITETVSWGVLFYAFSVFITPMEADLGWTRTQITGAFSLALLVSAAMAYPVGAWIDKHGPRALMTVGSIAAALLVVAWSQVTGIVAYYLIWTGLGICFAAVLYDPAFAVIAKWFEARRGRALAIVTFAAGLASTIFLPLSDALLQRYGWRGAVLILGVLLAVATIPLHLIVLRRAPDDMGLLPDGERPTDTTIVRYGATLNEAVNSVAYWQLVLAFGLAYMASAGIRVHFIPFLLDQGIAASTAAFASGSIGFMQVTGRLFFAPLDARFSGKTMVGGVFGMQAASIVILLVSPAALLPFIVVFGTSYGARTLTRPAILAQMYGAAHYGRINSVMTIFLTLAETAAPVGASWLYDRTGSYEAVLWIIFALMSAALATIFFMKSEVLTSQRSL